MSRRSARSAASSRRPAASPLDDSFLGSPALDRPPTPPTPLSPHGTHEHFHHASSPPPSRRYSFSSGSVSPPHSSPDEKHSSPPHEERPHYPPAPDFAELNPALHNDPESRRLHGMLESLYHGILDHNYSQVCSRLGALHAEHPSLLSKYPAPHYHYRYDELARSIARGRRAATKNRKEAVHLLLAKSEVPSHLLHTTFDLKEEQLEFMLPIAIRVLWSTKVTRTDLAGYQRGKHRVYKGYGTRHISPWQQQQPADDAPLDINDDNDSSDGDESDDEDDDDEADEAPFAQRTNDASRKRASAFARASAKHLRTKRARAQDRLPSATQGSELLNAAAIVYRLASYAQSEAQFEQALRALADLMETDTNQWRELDDFPYKGPVQTDYHSRLDFRILLCLKGLGKHRLRKLKQTRPLVRSLLDWCLWFCIRHYAPCSFRYLSTVGNLRLVPNALLLAAACGPAPLHSMRMVLDAALNYEEKINLRLAGHHRNFLEYPSFAGLDPRALEPNFHGTAISAVALAMDTVDQLVIDQDDYDAFPTLEYSMRCITREFLYTLVVDMVQRLRVDPATPSTNAPTYWAGNRQLSPKKQFMICSDDLKYRARCMEAIGSAREEQLLRIASLQVLASEAERVALYLQTLTPDGENIRDLIQMKPGVDYEDGQPKRKNKALLPLYQEPSDQPWRDSIRFSDASTLR